MANMYAKFILAGRSSINAPKVVVSENNRSDVFQEVIGSIFFVMAAPKNDPGTMDRNTNPNSILTSKEEAPRVSIIYTSEIELKALIPASAKIVARKKKRNPSLYVTLIFTAVSHINKNPDRMKGWSGSKSCCAGTGGRYFQANSNNGGRVRKSKNWLTCTVLISSTFNAAAAAAVLTIIKKNMQDMNNIALKMAE